MSCRKVVVSSRKDLVVFTIGVRIFSRKMESGDRIESDEDTIGLPGGLWSCLCTFGRV